MVPAPEEGQPDETRPMKALTPGSQVSHYRILAKLGQGGMGVVYKAEDTKLKRTVALKFLPAYLTEDPQARERFVHEAQAASALDHHNICTIHEIDETDDGHTFISMACYEGETLRGRMERGPLDLDEALDIAQQISEGLTKAHGKGIVHRDLKPANIMVTGDGVVKIMDFGLAKLAGRTKITRTGTTMGTPAYMSPEQAQGQEVDERSDIFSLGVVLYEMVTGRPAFKGEHEAAVLHSILYDEPEPLSDSRPGIPAQLQRIVDRALEKDISKRYQSTAEIAVDLAQLREDTRTGIASKPKKAVWRKRLVIPAVAVIAVVVAYIAFSLSGRDGPSDRPSELTDRDLFTIVVAPFWGATDEAMEEGIVMQALVEQKVRAELGGETDVKILSDAASEAPRSEEDARALGREADAAVVIWGEVFSLHGEVEIQPHMTYLRHGWRPLDPSASALETDLSQPSQLAMRRSKAEDVGNIVLLAAAFYYLWEDSDRAFTILRRIEPRSTEVILAEAIAEFYRGSRTEAERLCFEAAAQDTLDPQPHYTLGVLYSRLHRYDEAIPHLEKAFDIDPDQEHFRWELAQACADKGDVERALALWREMVDRDPGSSIHHRKLGDLYGSLLRFDDAIGEYKIAIRIEPDNPRAFAGLGWAYRWADSLDRAEAAFRRSGELAKQKAGWANISWALGLLYRQQRRFEEAAAEFHRAIELQPNTPFYYYHVMSTYDSLGREEEGLGILEAAAEAYPDRALFHDHLGRAYSSLGREMDAVAAYRQALRLDPKHGDTYLLLGQVLCEMDSLDQAASCFKEGAQLGFQYFSRGSAPQERLALVYLLQDLPEDAVTEIARAVDIEPDFSELHVLLGLAYTYQGRYAEAVEEFKRATEGDPYLVYYDIFYALSLHRTGSGEDGRMHLRQVAETFEGNFWEKSVMAFLTGNLGEAAFLELIEAGAPGPEIQRQRKCEACFYVGVAYLFDTDAILESTRPDTARSQECFEQCLDTRVWHFPEYHLARIELARLRGDQLPAREP